MAVPSSYHPRAGWRASQTAFHPPLIKATPRHTSPALPTGTRRFIGHLTHHTSVGRRDEAAVDGKEAAAEEGLWGRGMAAVNVLSKAPRTKAVTRVPAQSGSTEQLEPNWPHHLGAAFDCTEKHGLGKGKTFHCNAVRALLWSRAHHSTHLVRAERPAALELCCCRSLPKRALGPGRGGALGWFFMQVGLWTNPGHPQNAFSFRCDLAVIKPLLGCPQPVSTNLISWECASLAPGQHHGVSSSSCMDLPSPTVPLGQASPRPPAQLCRVLPTDSFPVPRLLVNQMFVGWQHKHFIQVFPTSKALRQ